MPLETRPYRFTLLATLAIIAVAMISVGLGLSRSAHAIEPPPSGPIVVSPDGALLEITQQITNITGDQVAPVEAGDVLQYHVAITNRSGESLPSGNPLTITTGLAGLAAQGEIQGVRAGTNGTRYCGPEAWSTSGNQCRTVPVSGDSATVTTALADGATYYVNIRVRASNAFEGDRTLRGELCVSSPLHDAPECYRFADVEIKPTYGDISVQTSWARSDGSTNGPIRAGDIIQYHVVVTNTGDGDWTAPHDWALDKRLTFTSDLAGLLDDAVLVGVRHGTSNSSYYCGPTAWGSGDSGSCADLAVDGDTAQHTFALASGRSHFFNVRVQATDHLTGDLELGSGSSSGRSHRCDGHRDQPG